jgi:hypothetical protein
MGAGVTGCTALEALHCLLEDPPIMSMKLQFLSNIARSKCSLYNKPLLKAYTQLWPIK